MMAQPKPVAGTAHGIPFRSLNELFLTGGTPLQEFRIDPARRTTIVGQKGTRLTFVPFSFKDTLGRTVVQEVTIYLREFFTQKDLILSDLVTTSEDRLLESGGQIYVRAFQQQESLFLQQPITVELPLLESLHNVLAMKLFKGSRSTTRVLLARNDFDWQWFAAGSIKIKKINNRKYFRFEIPELDWWSCGYFYNRRKSRKMMTAQCTGPYQEFEEQTAFLCFKKINATARMYPGIDRFTAINVPADLSATIIGIGLREEQLFFGKTEVSKIASRKVNLKLEPLGFDDFLAVLDRVMG